MSGHHRGKRFRAAYEQVDRGHHYPPAEAVALIKQTATTKFDETVEVHLRLGVNVRHAEEQLRGTLALPHGLGKEVSVAVFAEGDAAKAATEAGADHVGAQDLADRVNEGWTDFDVAIATPDLMGPVVSKLGRILGPQGKMPNPKVGTVTNDIAKAVGEAKAGKVEYRTDRQAVVHLTIGKASFDERALLENYAAVVEEIVRARPAAAKGRYLLSVTLATTMGPGIRVDASRTREAEILVGAGNGATAPRRAERDTGGGACVESDTQANLPKTAGGADRDQPGRPAQARPRVDAPSPPACGLFLRATPEPTEDTNLNKDEKAALVDEIADRLGDASAIFAVDYRGISVPQAAELRAQLSEADATFRVVKNRLAKRAVERAGTARAGLGCSWARRR